MFISIAILVIFAGCMLMASWSDMTTMTIPNWISLALIGGFFVVIPFAWPGWAGFGTHLLVGLLFFALGVGMFAMNWMGGGDAKLLAATSLWWVWQDLPFYLVYTAVAGGVLALFLILGRKYFPVTILKTDWLHRLFKDEKRMPYGLALAFGALATLPHSEIWTKAAGI